MNDIRILQAAEIAAVAGAGGDIPYCGTVIPPPRPWLWGFDYRVKPEPDPWRIAIPGH